MLYGVGRLDRVNAILTFVTCVIVILQATYSIAGYLPAFGSGIFQSLTTVILSPAEFLIALLVVVLLVRLARRRPSAPVESASGPIGYREVPRSIAQGVLTYRDPIEAGRIRQTSPVFGSNPVVASMLEQRYGPGFTSLDCEILRAWLVRGRSTPYDISVFLNIDIMDVLARLKFMEVKGVITLTPASA